MRRRLVAFTSPIPLWIAIVIACVSFGVSEQAVSEQSARANVMLILRGVANEEYPRGALDDESALEYARRLGFRGEVLDVAGYHAVDSEQVKLALDRIHRDDTITAIYAFSAGGYNTRYIWSRLTAAERERIRKLVVIGAPGVTDTDFDGIHEVLIRQDPPEGHLAGPKILLESLGSGN